jgi:hypothetical protein
MALDPRLMSLELLTMAAMRARERKAGRPPGRPVVLQIAYVDARGLEPPELGERYVYYVPATGPAWRASAC